MRLCGRICPFHHGSTQPGAVDFLGFFPLGDLDQHSQPPFPFCAAGEPGRFMITNTARPQRNKKEVDRNLLNHARAGGGFEATVPRLYHHHRESSLPSSVKCPAIPLQSVQRALVTSSINLRYTPESPNHSETRRVDSRDRMKQLVRDRSSCFVVAYHKPKNPTLT